MVELAKLRISTVPVAVGNALEVIEITELYKGLLNFEATCTSLRNRVAVEVDRAWRSRSEVKKFCALNSDKQELVSILLNLVHSVPPASSTSTENQIPGKAFSYK